MRPLTIVNRGIDMQTSKSAAAVVAIAFAIAASWYPVALAKPLEKKIETPKLSGSSTYKPPHFGWCRPPKRIVHGRCMLHHH